MFVRPEARRLGAPGLLLDAILLEASARRHVVRRGWSPIPASRTFGPMVTASIDPLPQFRPCRLTTMSNSEKHYGIVRIEDQREMSGLEFVEGLVDGTLPLNTMAETLGYDVIEASKGRVVTAAVPHPGHRNPHGTVHGGL